MKFAVATSLRIVQKAGMRKTIFIIWLAISALIVSGAYLYQDPGNPKNPPAVAGHDPIARRIASITPERISIDLVLDGGSQLINVANAEGSYTFRIPQPNRSDAPILWVTLLDQRSLYTSAESGSEIVQVIKASLQNTITQGSPDIRDAAQFALKSILQRESHLARVNPADKAEKS